MQLEKKNREEGLQRICGEASSQRAPSVHNSDPDPGLDRDIPSRSSKALQTRWAAGGVSPLGHLGTPVCDSHPADFSRDHKVPASVCSQSDKHSMGVGGWISETRAGLWVPGRAGQGTLGQLQLGYPGCPSGNDQVYPLCSVDQENGWEGSSTHQGPPPPL